MRYQLGPLHVVVSGTRTGRLFFRVDFDERQGVRFVRLIRRRRHRCPMSELRGRG